MAKVIYASTKDSDMFYAVRVPVVDPFFFIDTGKKQYVFLDHREFGLFREENKNTNIELVLLNPLLEEADKIEDETRLPNKLALYIFQIYGIVKEPIEVPASFPLDMADFLRSKGITLIPQIPFWPERSKKTEEEVEAIRESLRRTQCAFERIEEILRESSIDGDLIKYKDEMVTSELLKREAERVLLEHDMINMEGMIVSCAQHAAIPHHSGRGPMRPHQTIICDIFPQHRNSGYFADMTRTYIKGGASLELQRMYEAVRKSQEAGIQAARPGISGGELHKICSQVFLDLGYDVGNKGFVHGTGHGLGLDIHEEPYVNLASETILEPGHVITIEPGLYYPETGGVRIEDVIHITETGCENLINYDKRFILP